MRKKKCIKVGLGFWRGSLWEEGSMVGIRIIKVFREGMISCQKNKGEKNYHMETESIRENMDMAKAEDNIDMVKAEDNMDSIHNINTNPHRCKHRARHNTYNTMSPNSPNIPHTQTHTSQAQPHNLSHPNSTAYINSIPSTHPNPTH